MENPQPVFQIRPFDFKDTDLAFAFLRDSFFISYGNNPNLWPNNLGDLTQEQHVSYMRSLMARDPRSVFSIWLEDRLVGHMELSSYKKEPACGYVSFYYLLPEFRGRGLGAQLDQFATEEFIQKGFKKARLTVSDRNLNAKLFYAKQGWHSVGFQDNNPGRLLLEKIFNSLN